VRPPPARSIRWLTERRDHTHRTPAQANFPVAPDGPEVLISKPEGFAVLDLDRPMREYAL
jgi:hypothetical protein